MLNEVDTYQSCSNICQKIDVRFSALRSLNYIQPNQAYKSIGKFEKTTFCTACVWCGCMGAVVGFCMSCEDDPKSTAGGH